MPVRSSGIPAEGAGEAHVSSPLLGSALVSSGAFVADGECGSVRKNKSKKLIKIKIDVELSFAHGP